MQHICPSQWRQIVRDPERGRNASEVDQEHRENHQDNENRRLNQTE